MLVAVEHRCMTCGGDGYTLLRTGPLSQAKLLFISAQGQDIRFVCERCHGTGDGDFDAGDGEEVPEPTYPSRTLDHYAG